MKLTKMMLWLVAAFALTIAGCASKSDDPPFGVTNKKGGAGKSVKPDGATSFSICSRPANHQCSEMPTSLVEDSQGALETECRASGGQIEKGVCPSYAHVGTCILIQNGTAIKVRFYEPEAAENAQQDCKHGGGQFSRTY